MQIMEKGHMIGKSINNSPLSNKTTYMTEIYRIRHDTNDLFRSITTQIEDIHLYTSGKSKHRAQLHIDTTKGTRTRRSTQLCPVRRGCGREASVFHFDYFITNWIHTWRHHMCDGVVPLPWKSFHLINHNNLLAKVHLRSTHRVAELWQRLPPGYT